MSAWARLAMQSERASLLQQNVAVDGQISELHADQARIRARIGALDVELAAVDAARGTSAETAPMRAEAHRAAERLLGLRPPHAWQIDAALAVCAGVTTWVCEQASRGKTLVPAIVAQLTQVMVFIVPLVALARQHESDLNAAVGFIAVDSNGRETPVDIAYVLDGDNDDAYYGREDGPRLSDEELCASLRGEAPHAAIHVPPDSTEATLLARLDMCDEGGVRLPVVIILSPEKFERSKITHCLLRACMRAGGWHAVAVDEAHVILEAGCTYRPSFLRLHLLAEIGASTGAPHLTWLLLSATAPPEMVLTISHLLGIDDEGDPYIHRGTTARLNMTYSIVPSQSQEGKLEQMSDLVYREYCAGRCGIVYVQAVQGTEKVAVALRQALCDGVAMDLEDDLTKPRHAEAYHAKLSMTRRCQVETWCREGQVSVTVATIALGMGVNFQRVRYVGHIDLPKSGMHSNGTAPFCSQL